MIKLVCWPIFAKISKVQPWFDGLLVMNWIVLSFFLCDVDTESSQEASIVDCSILVWWGVATTWFHSIGMHSSNWSNLCGTLSSDEIDCLSSRDFSEITFRFHSGAHFSTSNQWHSIFLQIWICDIKQVWPPQNDSTCCYTKCAGTCQIRIPSLLSDKCFTPVMTCSLCQSNWQELAISKQVVECHKKVIQWYCKWLPANSIYIDI